MSQLEPVFLANVVLFIPSLETIYKLVRVSKKCLEAIKIIRYFKPLKQNENEIWRNYKYIPNNLFDLFPNIETIECNEADIERFISILLQVKQIKLITNFFVKLTLPNEIKQKVIEIECSRQLPLTDFPNIKKAKVHCEDDITKTLGNTNLILDKLIVTCNQLQQLNRLKEYKLINHKLIILDPNTSSSTDILNDLKSFATVIFDGFSNGKVTKDCIPLPNFRGLQLDVGNDIEEINRLMLFTACRANGTIDLRRCEYLERLSVNKDVQIEGLTNLKKISNLNSIKDLKQIPSSVTNISFYPSFSLKNDFKKGLSFYTNIKAIEIDVFEDDDCGNTGLFLNFTNCEKISIDLNYDYGQCYKFPRSLTQLKMVRNNICDSQFREITSLKNLKQLVVDFIRADAYAEEITSSVDLSQSKSLKNICLSNSSRNHREVKLPKALEVLKISKEITILNYSKITVKELILNNTPSQQLKWNAENVIIESEYKKTDGSSSDSDEFNSF